MFILPTELDMVVLSDPVIVDHKEVANIGDSGPDVPLRGMFIALPPITGDESGDDCSARVEW